jgi:hypothetical protein
MTNPQFYQKAAGSTDNAPKAPSTRIPTLSFPPWKASALPQSNSQIVWTETTKNSSTASETHTFLWFSRQQHKWFGPGKQNSPLRHNWLVTEPRIIRYIRNSLRNLPRSPFFSPKRLGPGGIDERATNSPILLDQTRERLRRSESGDPL